jgi:hypothetical protein
MPTYPDVWAHFPPSTNFDAFGRLRVSNPETLFDYQAQYDAGSLLWEDDLTGSATAPHNAASSSVRLTVTTASGDKVIRQTRVYHRYQPGKSQFVLVTFNMATGQANMLQKVGYFDGDNGFFFKESNGTLSMVKRSDVSGSPVDTEILQKDWSYDPLDGNGPSGLTIDATKSLIWFADLEWLGVGKVRVGFVISGKFILVHEFNHSNLNTSVYMTTANLPVRYEIENTAGVSSGTYLQAICASVVSEGGFETARGIPFNTNSGTTLLAVGTSRLAVVSIRPKATFNSIVNRGLILPARVNGYSETKGTLFEIVYDGTLGGTPSFSSVDDDSIVEADTAATTCTNGQVIDSFYVAASSQGSNSVPGTGGLGLLGRIPLTLDIAGANPKHLTLAATTLDTSSSVGGTISWQEVR